MKANILATGRNARGDMIYHLLLDECSLKLTVSFHIYRRAVDRWASLGLWNMEAVAELMRKIVCEEEMADYILFGVRLDGQEHKYMVLDQKRGLIFTMIVKNDSVVISTAISGTKDIIWYDEEDTLLVIEKDGAVHETTEKEHPRFARKTQN